MKVVLKSINKYLLIQYCVDPLVNENSYLTMRNRFLELSCISAKQNRNIFELYNR